MKILLVNERHIIESFRTQLSNKEKDYNYLKEKLIQVEKEYLKK